MRSYRPWIAILAALFGAGAIFGNGVALLAPPAARHPGDPVMLLAFDAAMGLLYFVLAWQVGWARPRALWWVWAVAVLHALSASVSGTAYVLDLGVSGVALAGTILRAAFWALVAIYLGRRPPANAPARGT